MKIKTQYVGRRINDDKIYHCFMYGKRELFFTHAKWCRIGKWYCADKKGKDFTKARSPETTAGDLPSDELLTEWQAKDQAAYEIMFDRRVANRILKKPQIFSSVENLIAAYKKTSSREQKYLINAFWQYVVDEAHK